MGEIDDIKTQFRAAVSQLQTASESLLAGIEMLEQLGEEPGPPQIEPPIDVIYELPWARNPRYPFPSGDRELSKVRYLTVHHSGATLRKDTSITAWNSYHVNTKSWSHIGYHFAIGSYNRGDPIRSYQCNRIPQVAWHDARNYDTIGIVLAGDLRAGRDDHPTTEQSDLFGQLIAWLLPQLPNVQAITIVGHWYWQATACPGGLDRWGQSLVDASLHYGVDIAPLLRPGVPKRTVSERLASALSRALRPDMGPPLSDYEDV